MPVAGPVRRLPRAGLRLIGLVVLTVLAVAGCRGRRPSAVVSSPSPTPGPLRIAVVDLAAVSKAHPRWTELAAMDRRAQELQAELASPSGPAAQAAAAASQAIQAQLQAQVRQLDADFQQVVAAINAAQEARLKQFGAHLQAEQQAKLTRLEEQVRQEFAAAMSAKQAALHEELRRYELQVMDEYRFPIANLRLKADVVGVANEQELKQLLEGLDRLQEERDAKIQAKAQALDDLLSEFQKAREVEAKGRLERAAKAATAESQRLVEARKRELDAEFVALVKVKRAEFEKRLAEVRRQVGQVAQGQLQVAQGRYVEGLRKRQQQLQAEQQALAEQRARLEDAILSEVQIEAAAVAAARGIDIVLTRYEANVLAVDITRDIIARIKR